MASARPFPWERAYPPGVRWDAPILPSSLPALLDQAVAEHADHPAFDYRDRKISYREFGELVRRAAAGLAALGLGRDDAVALYMPNTPFYPVALFAAWQLGIRLVNLSPLDAERELMHKLADSGARTVITSNLARLSLMAQKLAAAGHLDRVIIGDDSDWGPCPAPLDEIPEREGVVRFSQLLDAPHPATWPEVTADDIALLQYTGGTTGKPKGAMLTHANLTAAVAIYRSWYTAENPEQRERVIGVLPLFHIYGLSSVMLRCLASGNELLLRPRFDVETTLRDIEVKRATSFPAVPTMWIAIASVPNVEARDFSSLRFCSSGGAPLPVEIGQRIGRITNITMGGGWGMTETSPAGTLMLGERPPRSGEIGVPLPGIEMDIVALDDSAKRLPAGEIGEIRIKGPNVMRGYWNKPQETAAAFVDGHFLTGDIGYMDEEGCFFIVDRKKDMILSGGFNVYPRFIEEAIYEHPDVEEVIVVGVPDDYRGEAAKAFIKMRAGRPALTLDTLRDFLADKIGRHEMPAALEIRDVLPRTAVGKLSKRELVEEERRKHSSAAPQPQPMRV